MHRITEELEAVVASQRGCPPAKDGSFGNDRYDLVYFAETLQSDYTEACGYLCAIVVTANGGDSELG